MRGGEAGKMLFCRGGGGEAGKMLLLGSCGEGVKVGCGSGGEKTLRLDWEELEYRLVEDPYCCVSCGCGGGEEV
jgi:hypothetical protein